MIKLQKNHAVRIIKRPIGRSKPESNKNRQQNSESEIKKTVESWIHDFKRRRHRMAASASSVFQS